MKLLALSWSLLTLYWWYCIFSRILSPTSVTGQLLFCDEDFECVGDNIIFNGTVVGRGYKSNYGPTSSIKSYNVYGDAAFAFYQISSVSSDSQLSITGSNGGMFATLTLEGYTYAEGVNALAYATVISSNTTVCSGDMSCDGAVINGTSLIYGSGSHSLMNSLINSNNIGQLTLILTGYYAGYGAILNCNGVNDTCDVICLGNACFGLILNCVGQCSVSYCDGSETLPCPINVTSLSDAFMTEIPKIPDEEQDTFQLNMTRLSIVNDDSCSSSGAYLFDSFDKPASDSYQSVMVSNDNQGDICCRASSSCTQLDSIEIENSASSHIVCSGTGACRGSDLISTYNSPNSNIYCDSTNACENSVIAASDTGIIHCGSWKACYRSVVYNASALYCAGYATSCGLAEMNGVSNIYFTGLTSGDNAVINSDGLNRMESQTINIYFASFYCASNVTIRCDYGDSCNIYCLTNESCIGTVAKSCENNINVFCDESDGFECPEIIDHCPTGAPTNPTAGPTLLPTVEPTNIPTTPQTTGSPDTMTTDNTGQGGGGSIVTTLATSLETTHSAGGGSGGHSNSNHSHHPATTKGPHGSNGEGNSGGANTSVVLLVIVLCLACVGSIGYMYFKRKREASSQRVGFNDDRNLASSQMLNNEDNTTKTSDQGGAWDTIDDKDKDKDEENDKDKELNEDELEEEDSGNKNKSKNKSKNKNRDGTEMVQVRADMGQDQQLEYSSTQERERNWSL